jgi:hypothetical protein
MVEAARTMASPAAIWAIVIVAVVALAFWLVAIYLADRSQVRASGRARAATRPVYAGSWATGSMADEQAGEIPEQAAPEQAAPEQAAPEQAASEPAEARGRHVRDEPATEGETPTRVDIPAQPAAGSGRHAMPAQRTGDADRPDHSGAGRSNTGRSGAGQGTPEEDQGR